jgi:type II secretory pathway pseudopilin PulG
LLIVVAIVLLITFMALPVVMATMKDRKLSDASRAIQAALAGARDRAIESGQVSGLRFVRSAATDAWDCSTLLYVGTSEPYTVGTVTIANVDNVNNVNGNPTPDGIPESATVTPTAALDPHFEQVDPGRDGQIGAAFNADNIPRVEPGQSYIRFDHSGPFYLVTAVNPPTPPATAATLTISPPVPATLITGPHSYQLFGPPSPLAGERDAAINLADGIVIDLRFGSITAQFGATHPLAGNPSFDVPRSRALPNQIPREAYLRGSDGIFPSSDDPSPAAWPYIEILFGPDGNVVGQGAATPLMHIWVGERTDKLAIRPHRLITFNTRTTSVRFFDEPAVSGTAPSFPEIYGPPEQLLGTSQTESLGCVY